MTRLFGTDGVRGVANRELSPELVLKLGRAGASVLTPRGDRPILIGRDTRISGDMLEAALVAGITSAGVNAVLLGVVPTPAVAYLTKTMDAAAGVVISASHNPVADNGVKFFSGNGFKLPDALEDEIAERIEKTGNWPTGEGVGRVRTEITAWHRYVEFLMQKCVSLKGLKVVVDGAHGAASHVAPYLLTQLGADVVPINVEPNGVNINVECGSTHPAGLQVSVLAHGADAGLAYDGDADRVIAVDEKGQLVDGDHILAICGLDLLRQGKLKKNTIAATLYSNVGLRMAMGKEGGEVLITQAGDRYVLETMLASGLSLGGEQSGHVIFLEHSTTGDGLLTGLQLLSVMQRTGRQLSELAAQMPKLPQRLVSVPVCSPAWEDNQAIVAAIGEAQRLLSGQGRILVRASGTEPLIRVMAEGTDAQRVEELVKSIAEVIDRELGQGVPGRG